jgi:hypothetical protein
VVLSHDSGFIVVTTSLGKLPHPLMEDALAEVEGKIVSIAVHKIKRLAELAQT